MAIHWNPEYNYNTKTIDAIDEGFAEAAIEGWTPMLDALEWPYKQRRTGAIIARCLMHSERTPSFVMRPSLYYTCYGCGAHGERSELVVCQSVVQPTALLAAMEVKVDPVYAELMDAPYLKDKAERAEHQAWLATLLPGEEPF